MSSSSPDRPSTDLDHQASTSRRFVVQLRLDSDPPAGVYRGRVQHLRSGEAAHFDSLDELAAFFAAMALKERSAILAGASRDTPAP